MPKVWQILQKYDSIILQKMKNTQSTIKPEKEKDQEQRIALGVKIMRRILGQRKWK